MRQKSTWLYFIAPLIANATLFLSIAFNQQFLNTSATACYAVAIIATFCALFPLFGLVFADVSIRRNLVSFALQAITLILIFAMIHYSNGLGSEKVAVGFADALYFSIVTWTTLGYGDFAPAESLRLLAALQAILGYVFLGLIVGLALNARGRSPKA